MYSEKVLQHFQSPQNAFYMRDPSGIGESGDSACGDQFTMFIRVTEGVVSDVSFLVFGCGAAIACGSMTTVLAKGKSIDDALKITETDIVEALEGLPENKQHCSNLGVVALRGAIQDYFSRQD